MENLAFQFLFFYLFDRGFQVPRRKFFRILIS